MKSNIQLTAAHIPGKQNIIADRESRVCHVDSEWMLSPRYLHQSLNLLSFKPDIDLFATQIKGNLVIMWLIGQTQKQNL